ncbi:transcription factor grauzone-like [Stomoxys calcitrans]|uniref:transcription factor grauzone-like n=1 Tax=Stomoxys calcitrans TaxID=35570 RepID=UPI0027E2C87A|nr:transcription factor grauzone-like [Stomoxys calcitrans]
MSSTTHLCRLCANLSQDGSLIYNNEGQPNELYNLMLNYLPTKIIDLEKFKHISIICNECWHSLEYIRTFHQTIDKAQEKLSQEYPDAEKKVEDFETIGHNLNIKVEQEFITESQTCEAETINNSLEIWNSTELLEDNTDLGIEEKESKAALEFLAIQREVVTKTSHSHTPELSALHEGCEDPTQNEPQPSCSSYTKFTIEEDLADGGTTSSDDDDDIPLAKRFAKTKSLEDSDSKTPEASQISYPTGTDSTKLFDFYFSQVMPAVKCVVCLELFETYSLYREHFYKAHPNRRFHIICCYKKMGSSKVIKPHILNKHTNVQAPQCQHCGLKCMTAANLKSHITIHHAKFEKPRIPAEDKLKTIECFPCTACTRQFKTQQYLRLHITRHHASQKVKISAEDNLKMGETLAEELKCNDAAVLDDLVATWLPSIQCVLCPEVLSKYSVYREHFQKKHPHKYFYLSCCDTKLQINKKVLDHMLFHNNPETFKCKPCNSTFANEASLRRHNRRLHTTLQDRKFSCQQCTKSYTTRKGLSFHCTQKHSVLSMPEEAIQEDGSSVYNCKDCDYSTQSYNKFSTHRWSNHNPRNSYTCQICDKTFKVAANLRNHLNTHAGNRNHCSICGSHFKNFEGLRRHKQVFHQQQAVESNAKVGRRHACSICSAKFPLRLALKLHMQSEHPGKKIQKNRISCTLCPLKFTNSAHFRLHLRKKHGKTSLEIKEEIVEEEDGEKLEEESSASAWDDVRVPDNTLLDIKKDVVEKKAEVPDEEELLVEALRS